MRFTEEGEPGPKERLKIKGESMSEPIRKTSTETPTSPS